MNVGMQNDSLLQNIKESYLITILYDNYPSQRERVKQKKTFNKPNETNYPITPKLREQDTYIYLTVALHIDLINFLYNSNLHWLLLYSVASLTVMILMVC